MIRKTRQPVTHAPRVDVIIPAYNRRHAIPATLDSVLAQTLPARKLIVVDDGSTDGTAGVVTRWSRSKTSDLTLQLIRQPNRGASDARNRGLLAARQADYLAFLDSDDCWPPDFLQRAVTRLQQHPRAVAASCDRAGFHEGKGRHLRPIAGDAVQWLFRFGAGIASCTVFRSWAVKRFGGFCTAYRSGEDIRLFLKIAELGPWLHVPGEAVTFGTICGSNRADEPNLSGCFRDNLRRWAELYEDFLFRSPQQASKTIKRLMAKRWYAAGKQLEQLGRCIDALWCYRRSLQWNLWHWKSFRGTRRLGRWDPVLPVSAIRPQLLNRR